METSANELKNAATSAQSMAQDKARQVADKAKQVASSVSERVQMGQDSAQEYYEMARQGAEDAYDASAEFIRKYPFATIAGAVTVGVVAGLLLRGSSKE